jgi:hypothetical protein
LAFDKGSQFAKDKAAGEPCGSLGHDGCTIYVNRRERGFAGCVRYDCQGAGQRVTQDLYQGVDWRYDPELMRSMSEAFLVVRRAHTMLALLRSAQVLPLEPAEQDQINAFESAFSQAGASPKLVAEEIARAQIFLSGLRHYVQRPRKLSVSRRSKPESSAAPERHR